MTLLLALLLALPLSQSFDGASDYPPADEFARRVRQGLQLDYQIQKDLFYLERRRDVKISRLGKVTVGPLRTFEVYPSDQPGRTYKKLIEIDGRPLTAEEAAQRDAEHQRNLRREAERERTETPRQRSERLQKAEEERLHREAMVDDAVAVFEARFVGREVIEGRRVLVADLTPLASARVRTREGRWMKHFAGRIWVDEAQFQVVRLDMRAFEDVTIGWGIVGRIHEDSRLLYRRRLFENFWVPAELTYKATGRTLLFRPFEFEITTTYSDYRRR